jgi:hypothetical protein
MHSPFSRTVRGLALKAATSITTLVFYVHAVARESLGAQPQVAALACA